MIHHVDFWNLAVLRFLRSQLGKKIGSLGLLFLPIITFYFFLGNLSTGQSELDTHRGTTHIHECL